MILANAPAPIALIKQIGKDDVFWLFETFPTVIFTLGRVLTLEHVQLLQVTRAEEAADLLLVEDALGEALFLDLASVHLLLHCPLSHQSLF